MPLKYLNSYSHYTADEVSKFGANCTVKIRKIWLLPCKSSLPQKFHETWCNCRHLYEDKNAGMYTNTFAHFVRTQ